MSAPRPKGRLIGSRAEEPKPAAAEPSEGPSDDSEVFFAGTAVPVGQATMDVVPHDELPTDADLRDKRQPVKAVPLEIPKQLGSYRIEGEIARGGMGLVLRGHHEVLARDVAIKLLLPKAKGDRECFERFLLEAQATARLRHPGIVAIHDVARDPQGTPYLVMDYIAGQTLRQRIRDRGALAPKEVAEVMAVVADAVDHAHQQGILHRDLKPDNVIVDKSGAPHLTDFGLAKLVLEEESSDEGPSGRLLAGSKLELGLTNEGAVMGTPRYMAPEQVRGQRLTVAADVWALGVMLYEALTGRPPFVGKTVIAIFEAIVRTSPTPPSQLNPLIPARLERICLRCLEKDPSARPATAGEVATELRRELAAAQRPLRTAAPPPELVDGSKIVHFAKAGAFVLCLLAIPILFGPLRGSWMPAEKSAAVSPSYSPRGHASLEEAAEAGDLEAMARWGEHLLASGRADEGLEYLEQAADAGQAGPCLVLGRAYEGGQGVEVDADAALVWYRQGSEAGSGACTVAAGLLLARAEGSSARSEARDLLEEGLPATQGSKARRRVCLTILGRLYLDVAPRDGSRGVEYLEAAAKLGATGAMVDLARLQERGEFLMQDDEAALNWLKRAAAGEDSVAWIELGDVYASGRLGQTPSKDLARQAYERARRDRPAVVESRLKTLD